MKLRDIMNNIPREKLAPLPTPLQRLQNTEKLISSENKMYIKRDDLTGVGSGGNKVRCMEYIIGRAKADGCVGVLASGNGQSNLCSLAAASAAKAGMKCYIVHNSDKPEVSVGNALLNDLLGVEREYMGACDSSIREKYVSKTTQSIPVANVDTSSLNVNSINATDISKMSASEWAEYRAKLGLK